MNYIIYDLEYNQVDRRNNRLARTMKTRKPHHLQFEILQIGAIKLNNELKYVSNFKMYVRPKFLPTINKYVLDILNVDENYIRINGLYFDKVFNEFKNFIGNEENTLVTWSNNDIGVLQSNLKAWHIVFHLNKYKLIDLQKIVMNKDGLKESPSLKNIALEYGINFNELTLHDAYTDATVTKQLFQKIGIQETDKYNYDISFNFARKMNVDKNIMLSTEIKRALHCNYCGKFIKTVAKTKFYALKNRNIIQMNKSCYCNKCRTYIFKEYMYEIDVKTLSIKDKNIHENNIERYNSYKKEMDFLKNIEVDQLSE